MISVYARIGVIYNAPGNPYYLNTRRLRITLNTTCKIADLSLSGLETLTTNEAVSFEFTEIKATCLSFTVLETIPTEIPLAKLTLPLKWFQLNSTVKESYPMKPLVASIQFPVALIEVHVSNNADLPFEAPLGRLLVTPGWRPVPATKKPYIPDISSKKRPFISNTNYETEINSDKYDNIPMVNGRDRYSDESDVYDDSDSEDSTYMPDIIDDLLENEEDNDEDQYVKDRKEEKAPPLVLPSDHIAYRDLNAAFSKPESGTPPSSGAQQMNQSMPMPMSLSVTAIYIQQPIPMPGVHFVVAQMPSFPFAPPIYVPVNYSQYCSIPNPTSYGTLAPPKRLGHKKKSASKSRGNCQKCTVFNFLNPTQEH